MDYCVLLTSNLDTRYLNNVNQLKVPLLSTHPNQSFLTNKKIPFDEVEASDPSNRALRDSLVAVARTSPIFV